MALWSTEKSPAAAGIKLLVRYVVATANVINFRCRLPHGRDFSNVHQTFLYRLEAVTKRHVLINNVGWLCANCLSNEAMLRQLLQNV